MCIYIFVFVFVSLPDDLDPAVGEEDPVLPGHDVTVALLLLTEIQTCIRFCNLHIRHRSISIMASLDNITIVSIIYLS